jgi:hypothetical protein
MEPRPHAVLSALDDHEDSDVVAPWPLVSIRLSSVVVVAGLCVVVRRCALQYREFRSPWPDPDNL